MEEESSVRLVKVSEISSEPEKRAEQRDEEREEKESGDVSGCGGLVMVGGRVEGEVERRRKALEAAARGPSKPPPTGGINIPGFLRSTKSKDKKEGERECEEGVDLLEKPAEAPGTDDELKEDQPRLRFQPKIPKLRFSNPFAKNKKEVSNDSDKTDNEDDGEGVPRKPKLLNAIKLPLASVLPKKLKPTKPENEGPAGLASMETLDDSNGSIKIDDNMENVKLDVVEVDPEKAALEEEGDSKWAAKDWQHHLRLAKEHKLIVGGVSLFLILLIVVIIIAVAGPRVPTQAPIKDGKYITAITFCGPVEGVLEDGAFVFRGVPYAVPPIGNLRWAPPQPLQLHTCWNGTLKAHNATPTCWQIYSNGSIDGSEDCLTLDIFTPYVRYDAPLPVVVLIGSETLEGGSPGVLLPSSSLSWLKDIVLVRPNFRLSVLGFLAASPISAKAYPPTSGNYGLMDVASALGWVQLNIHNFGGDPKQVTVLGYKAGATLVTALTATHKVEKLFSRAWLSTGSSRFPNETLKESELTSRQYLEKLPCGDQPSADCLRKLDVEELLDNIPDSWRSQGDDGIGELPKDGEESGRQWLVIDGMLLREDPTLYWAKNNATVHVVLGTTDQCEATDKLRARRAGWVDDDVVGAIKGSLVGEQGLTDEVIQRYNTTLEGLSRAISDIRTICPLFTTHKRISNSNFYLATEVGRPGADVEAILGRFKPNSPNDRRFVSAIQRMFFHYVAHGSPPRHRMTTLGQDALPARELPHCTFWRQHGFEKFARVD